MVSTGFTTIWIYPEEEMIFFTGIQNISHASKVDYSFISINRLVGVRKRKSDFVARTWIMDSGAFSQVAKCGDHSLTAKEYAEHIKRWSRCGILVRAVAQDYMCEDFILEKLGRTVEEHQEMTIRNYLDLIQEMKDCDVPILPVLQGYEPEEYAKHVHDYGSLLKPNAWVGVGSICKRNSNPESIIDVLNAILEIRSDLRLHGFGIKKTCLQDSAIRDRLFSADSMSWIYDLWKANQKNYELSGALKFKNRIETMSVQTNFFDCR